MRALSILLACAGCALPAPVVPAPLAQASVTHLGEPSTPEALVTAARAAALVCAGEQHDDPRHHEIQHALQLALGEGRELGLGLEMLPWTEQPTLDEFSRGELGESGLAIATRWDERWGFDFAMYRPLLTTARARRQRIVALNAPREVTRWIARNGLEALPPARRAELPELVLDDAEHRRFFDAAIGGEHGTSDRIYSAQVIWDETMAHTAASWLRVAPRRQLLVIAGNGHCHESAIVRRLERRLPDRDALAVLIRSEGDDLPEHARADFVITVGP